MQKFSYIKSVKQILLSAVMLTLVLGPFQPLIAQAQTFTTGTVSPTSIPTSEPAPVGANATVGNTAVDTAFTTTGVNAAAAGGSGAVSNSTLATTATQPGAATQPTTGNAPQCNWTSNWDLCITNVVYVFTVGIGSGFAYVAAEFFNLAVNLSLSGPAYALTFISTGWTTARDLANMAFLFILIYIAFMIMLEAETSGTMSLLAGVIVIALLVNFSFFFTRLVIDAGNILSIQFYNSITAPPIQSSAQNSNVAAGVTAVTAAVGVGNNTKDLTASIMGMLQLQNLFNTQSFQNFYGPGNTGAIQGAPGFLVVVITLSFLYIAAAIMFYLLTVMFVTVGVKFLMRIVVLWFLIIASPLAFVAFAIPSKNKLHKYYEQWQGMLVSHAFYPAAFMFIFLILTNFTNQMGNCTNNGTSSSQSCLMNDIFTSLPTAANASSSSAMAVIGLAIANVAIRMGFVITILYLGIKAADSVSVMGASVAEKAGKWVGGAYKGATLGLASRTGGLAFRETIGRQAQNDIDNLKKNPPTGRVGQFLDYTWRKNVLAPIAGASVGGAQSYTDVKKERGARREDWESNKRAADNAEAIKIAIGKIIAGTPLDPKEKNTIQRISKREFEGMKVGDIKAISTVLTEDQIKKIGDIEKIAEKDREEIKAKWEEKSEEAPFNKSLKKLKELTDAATGSAAANTALAAHKTAGGNIDGTFAASLKTILDDDHRATSINYTEKDTEFRDASRALRPFKVAHDAAVSAHTAAPTAATAAAVAASAAALAPHAALHATAQAAINAAHAERQKTQNRLDSFKEFDDNRKKVEPNATLNNNGVKGTYKSSLV
jgi:hypothetical protein